MNNDDFADKIASLPIEQVANNQKSWEHIEKLFREFSTADYSKREAAPVYELMKYIVVTDIVKLFRAGHSMWTLTISTEKQNHFTFHQPFVAIEVEENLTLQIKYMHTKGHVVLEKEPWINGTNPLKILKPYLVRLWNETRERN